MKKMVLFGAGKIGRSFIAQLFSRSGYEVVFIDISPDMVEELNRRRAYDIVIKHPDRDETIRIGNVRGVLFADHARTVSELASCDIAAVSVGQRGLEAAAGLIADGLSERHRNGAAPLDIIIAENMRDAAGYLRGLLGEKLGADFPLGEMAGLVETSIGKMVPIMQAHIQARDLLLVYAEPYNTLILDRKGFLNPVPDVEGLAPKDNIKAWVDRKSYIHNFGHAAAAYAGYHYHPDLIYIWEVLEDPDIRSFTRSAMRQSAAILKAKYPDEFSEASLDEHIEDLLARFRNRALGDTVYRVGCDLPRKLGRNDRVLSPLLDGIKTCLQVDKIAEVFIHGLVFRACDESGNMMPADSAFVERLRRKGLTDVLQNVCGLLPDQDRDAIDMIEQISAHKFSRSTTI